MIVTIFIVVNLLFWYCIVHKAEPLYTLYYDYGYLMIHYKNQQPRVEVLFALTDEQTDKMINTLNDIDARRP